MTTNGMIAAFVLGAVLVAASFGLANVNYSTETYLIKKEPERVCSGSGEGMSCKYLIFTDKTTIANQDSLWHGKFNSSDIHGRINIGDVCEITSVGFRVPFLSMYKNAIKVQCTTELAGAST